MENDTTAYRQKKYKLNNHEKGFKRVGVIVPIIKAKKIKLIAKKMREAFKKANKE